MFESLPRLPPCDGGRVLPDSYLRIRDLRRADGAVEGERRLVEVVERHG